MAAPSKKSSTNSAFDIPAEIIERIISYFPVKDASRAALVSRRFIDSWKLGRNLCFDENQQIFPALFGIDIDRVMTQHSGTKIDKLALTIYPVGLEDRIHTWLHQAARKGVEELELNITGGSKAFQVPSDLIDVDSIKVLKLHYCDPLLRSKLNGLKFLKTLHLDKVFITPKLMLAIFHNCYLLEDIEVTKCRSCYGRVQIFAGQMKHLKSLKVVDFLDITSVYINAPTLESFSYSGELCPFIINCSLSKLNDVELKFGTSKTVQEVHRVEQLMMNLTLAKKMRICSKILEGLSLKLKGSDYVDEIRFEFSRMKELSLVLGGSSNAIREVTTFVNPCDIAYFLRRCPVLDRIYIDLGDYTFEDGFYWSLVGKEKFEKCNPSFPALKNLTIRGFKYRDLEFKLLKMIVENAPSLERVSLMRTITANETVTRDQMVDWMRAQRCNIAVRSASRLR